MPFHSDDSGPFFQLAKTTIQQAHFVIHQHPEEREWIAGHYERIELLLTHFVALQSNPLGNISGIDKWIQTIEILRIELRQKLEDMEIYDQDTGLYHDEDVIPTVFIPRFQQSTCGRPKYQFQWDKILAYQTVGYTWISIPELLGVSPCTLRRYRKDNNVPEPKTFSNITNNELDSVIHNIIQQSAGVLGSQFIQSALLDLGLYTQ